MAEFKFPMHDIHFHKSIRNIKSACFVSVCTGLVFVLGFSMRRRLQYKTFYSTYDPLTSFERMADGGYLSSCPPTGATQKKKQAEEDRKEADKKRAQQKHRDDKKKDEEKRKG